MLLRSARGAMDLSHLTPFEQRQERLLSFATTSERPEDSAGACVRALYHRRGWADPDKDVLATLEGVYCPQSLAGWLASQGHMACGQPKTDWRIDDIVWWDAPGTGPARFVIVRGEQPGQRVAYWDPYTGQATWRVLDPQPSGMVPGVGKVRIQAKPIMVASGLRLRTGWRAWLFGA